MFYLEHETPPSTTDVAKKNESTIQLQVYVDASSRVNKHFTCRLVLSSFSFSFHFKRILLGGNSTLSCTVLEIFIYHKDHSLVNCQSNMNEIPCRCSLPRRRVPNDNRLPSFRSREQKCTKPRACSSGRCTWNERLTFFDIDTLDNLSLWAKLVDLDRNQDSLGEVIDRRDSFLSNAHRSSLA